jgi:hypothetical protein
MSAMKKKNEKEKRSDSLIAAPLDLSAAIARLAFEKWHARGCPQGDDQRDWFEAEQELSAASSVAKGG